MATSPVKYASNLRKILEKQYPDTLWGIKQSYWRGTATITVIWTGLPDPDDIYDLLSQTDYAQAGVDSLRMHHN